MNFDMKIKNNDPTFRMISIGFLVACLYFFSELLVYLTCLLIPAYFTYRSLKEKASENVKLKIMKYWICYAFLSFPLKFISNLLLQNDMIADLIQIIIFSNLYHPRSQISDIILSPLQKILTRYDNFFRRFTKGFFDGFEGEIMKK